jgi:RNA polymerase sigma-70 factor (ECF subfamily)
MADQPVDHSLLATVTSDDRFALGVLLIQEYASLRSFVHERLPTRLRSLVDPDDVVQQVVLKAVQGVAGLESHSVEAFRAWLLRIAERQVLDTISSHDRVKRGGGLRRLPAHPSSVSSRYQPLARLVARDETPSRQMGRSEIAHAIQQAMLQLPTPQRNAMRLHDLEGQTVTQVGVALARSPGAVRGMLQRARLTLRHALGKSSRWFSSRRLVKKK